MRNQAEVENKAGPTVTGEGQEVAAPAAAPLYRFRGTIVGAGAPIDTGIIIHLERPEPAVDYAAQVPRFDEMSAEERADTQAAIDELFTREEGEELEEVLEEKFPLSNIYAEETRPPFKSVRRTLSKAGVASRMLMLCAPGKPYEKRVRESSTRPPVKYFPAVFYSPQRVQDFDFGLSGIHIGKLRNIQPREKRRLWEYPETATRTIDLYRVQGTFLSDRSKFSDGIITHTARPWPIVDPAVQVHGWRTMSKEKRAATAKALNELFSREEAEAVLSVAMKRWPQGFLSIVKVDHPYETAAEILGREWSETCGENLNNIAKPDALTDENGEGSYFPASVIYPLPCSKIAKGVN